MTTASLGAPYYLQVGGTWRHLESVAPGVAVTPDRPTSVFKSIGNVVWAQVADEVKRAWGFSLEWEDVEAGRWLDYAAANPNTEAWLLDLNLAQINMLAAEDTKGTSTTLVDVDGLAMPAFTGAGPKLSASVRVRAGQTYHLSYTTTLAAGTVVGSRNLDGSLGTFRAPAGTGARRGSVSFRPATDQVLGIGWEGDGFTSGARLTEGSVDDLGFLESRGKTPCEVMVGDGTATYKMAWADRLSLADSTYVLTELG